ncbi:hypothetical protein PS710_00093 [Pseudomonas fluorescens]|uniref:Uncharacterized protein n=1 Tax=Pseudomonas fluorescens TaxID=294 RepID=A0A5E6ZNK0_PSEFL|nr:hypothetical protein PS710_00093 [Pseudomonas fluorescens]
MRCCTMTFFRRKNTFFLDEALPLEGPDEYYRLSEGWLKVLNTAIGPPKFILTFPDPGTSQRPAPDHS